MSISYQLGFVGAGNMAEGIAAGLLAKGLYAADAMIASDPAAGRRDVFAKFGIEAIEDNRHVASESAAIVLAVKPQSFAEVAEGLRGTVGAEQVVISIMAGVGTSRIAAALGGETVRVVRVMPNLAIHVGAGMAGLCGGAHAGEDDVALACRIFNAAGESVGGDEAALDAVTAVSGAGPAYFYAFVEAIVAGGVAAGLTEADALKLAENTCLGAARMMLETGEPPAELRRKVTSPGGTTQAALASMDTSGVPEAIRRAVVAAADRSRELRQ